MSTRRHVIRINQDGTIRTLHTDAMPLTELGTVRVHRASHLEFDNTGQDWTVTIAKRGKRAVAFRNVSRTACLDWERNFFNAQLLA